MGSLRRTTRATTSRAAHTIAIGDGWSLWRRFSVRGSGFPAGDLLRLGLGETLREVDALLDAPPARQLEQAAAARGTFAREQARIYAEVVALARDDRFRQAVMWQNHDAAIHGIELLAGEDTAMTPRRLRQRARLAASYLQRYCAKADTVGFFGPVGWGRFERRGPAVVQRPGPALIARQRVYFEYWAIDALAQRIAELPGIKPWLAPRRVPTLRIDATQLSPLEARLLGDCDGAVAAGELARDGVDYTAVERALEGLVARGLVTWTLEVPVGSPYPERRLRELVEGIGDPELRRVALAMLDELETKRDAVGRAAGEPSRLAGALADAEQTFTRLTAAAATRHAGKTYAGRTIVYLDAERDYDLVLGPELLAGFADPLRLLLWSARWFMYTVVTRFEALFRELLAQHTAETGRDEMDYVRFWQGVAPHVAGGSAVQTGLRSALVQEVEAELQQRWAEVLGLDAGCRRLQRASAEIGDRVRAAFAAPHGGIELLRHHAPDISVAADSIAAIQRGDCSFVLSELHVGGNTFTRPMFFEQCSFAGELLAARRADLPHPEVFPILSKDMHLRFSPATYKDSDLHFETANAKSWLPRERVYAAGELTVRNIDGRAMVCSARDDRRFAAADFLAFYIIRASIQSFSMTPPLPHTPRITIDRLTVARECWRMKPSEMPFLKIHDDFDRLVAARRWMRAHGMPRCVFVKVPAEKKPCYVDLESPIYLDLFRRIVRTAPSVVISEMLPTIEQSWLADRDDRRYVCELRLAAVDPAVAPSSTATRSSQT